jgi:hypothetical protein
MPLTPQYENKTRKIMHKPDKSTRVKINATTHSTGSVDPNTAQEITDLSASFFEAMEKKQKKSQTKGDIRSLR